MALSDPPPISPAREQEIRNRWVDEDGRNFDWSVHGSALAGMQALKDIRDLLSLVSSLRQEQERLKKELRQATADYKAESAEHANTIVEFAQKDIALRKSDQQVQTLTAERDGLKEALTAYVAILRQPSDQSAFGLETSWLIYDETRAQIADELMRIAALTPPVRSAKEADRA